MNNPLLDQGSPLRGGGLDLSDSRVRAGWVGTRDLSKGWYSFAEAMTVVCEWLVAKHRDREVLASLRTSGRSVREYFRTEFGMEVGARQYYTPPRVSPDSADLREFSATLDAVRWEVRRPTGVRH